MLPSPLQDVIDAALERRPLRLAAGADHPCQPIHVEDVARAVDAALGAPAPASRIYDVTGGERVRSVRSSRWCATGSPAPTSTRPRSSARVGPPGPVAITAADRELGYRPRWGLARGIDDYCTWRESSDLAEGAA